MFLLPALSKQWQLVAVLLPLLLTLLSLYWFFCLSLLVLLDAQGITVTGLPLASKQQTTNKPTKRSNGDGKYRKAEEDQGGGANSI